MSDIVNTFTLKCNFTFNDCTLLEINTLKCLDHGFQSLMKNLSLKIDYLSIVNNTTNESLALDMSINFEGEE